MVREDQRSEFDKVVAWYSRRYRANRYEAMRPLQAYRPFLDLLDPSPGESLLDVGCGTGFLLRLAAEAGLRTCGVDVAEEAVSLSRSVSPRSRVKRSEAESLPFEDDYFNYVTCLGSLEHFLDTEAALAEMRRVAHPHAKFLIVVPNVDFLWWKLTGLPGTEQQEIVENLRTIREWQSIFEQAGFRILGISKDPWYLSRKIHDRRGISGSLLRLAARLAYQVIPLSLNYQLIFLMTAGEAGAQPSVG